MHKTRAAAQDSSVLEGRRPGDRDSGPLSLQQVVRRGCIIERINYLSVMNEREGSPERRRPVHCAPVERYNRPVLIFLTVCTFRRRKILAQERVHAAIRAGWAAAGQWHVGRYVILPDHIHLFCTPARPDAENVARWVAYWKRQVSARVPQLSPIWQRDCWDTQLRGHESYSEKWAYVLNNPVRAGLADCPDGWPFQGEIHSLRW